MKNFKAVLFDFDGVLGDTIDDLCSTWQKAFRDYGIEIKLEDYPPLEGMKMVEIARRIGRKYGRELSDEECFGIKKLKDRYYLQDHKFSFYPGVPELIDRVKAKAKLAIVSASPREKLERTVPKEFLQKFDVIISGEDTTEGKPSPQPYLTAIQKLNLEPEDCVVVENAPLGIQSAKAAGIYCIAITTTLSRESLIQADEIVRNHKGLQSLLL